MIGEDLVQIMEVSTDKCFELNVYQTRETDNVMDTKSYQHRELHGRPVLDAHSQNGPQQSYDPKISQS